ncbi:MAG: hypothetical protein WA964_11830 [Ilumatobacter sp.]|uniref:hypothetical protein n=1 Tax=Ilumatobacter sp. TaxID=1967498 RepID=UPI003C71B1C2
MTTSPGPERSAATETRRTADTHRVIEGRKWRVSDPALDEPLRQHLVDELMHARRAVKTAKGDGDETELRSARDRVQDAKVALGERGPKWWEPVSEADTDLRIEAFIRTIGDRLGTLDANAARVHLRLD